MSEAMNDKKNISRHILPASSNLLGLCFVILTFIKILKLEHATIIDEIVAIAIGLFFLAVGMLCLGLFFYYYRLDKMRHNQDLRNEYYKFLNDFNKKPY